MAVFCNSATKSQIFFEKLTQDNNEYLNTFERIALANEWDDARKLIMFLLYLRDLTKKLFVKIEGNIGTPLRNVVKNLYCLL